MSKQQHSAAADLHKQVLANANACISTTVQLSADLRKEPQKVCRCRTPRHFAERRSLPAQPYEHKSSTGLSLTSSLLLAADSQSRLSASDRLGT